VNLIQVQKLKSEREMCVLETNLFQLPKLWRKIEVETEVVGLVGEGSRAKTFEHLQIFPILGECRSSGGGATSSI
jgi:hypothetical protein